MTKTILITGASSGIGLTTAIKLHDLGYQVYGTSQKNRLSTVYPFKMLTLDITDQASVDRCINYIANQAGRIDTLINNAGASLIASAEETNSEHIQQQLEVNFVGATRVIQSALPFMRKAQQGQIINISSLVGFAAIPFMSAYSASKFALEGYSEALYHELLPLGIHVSVIQPGMVKTPLFNNGLTIDNKIADYYDSFNQAKLSIAEHAQQGIEPHWVAEKIVSLCRNNKPPLISPVGPDAKLVSRLKRFLPTSVFNKIWHKEFGLNQITASTKTQPPVEVENESKAL